MMIRAVGIRGSIAINAITMIGIGPLITIPLIVSSMHGYSALIPWVLGAAIALCDGLVYAELGARFPASGGTYVYLREAFDSTRAGRLMSFLFVWQSLFYAILVLASGYIGFANYATFFAPHLAGNAVAQGLVGSTVGIVTIAALYRAIPAVSRIAIVLGVVACATLALVTLAGAAHGLPAAAQATPHGWTDGPFVAGLGAALIVALYDYAGYNAANALGDEIRDPSRTLPRAVMGAVVLVAALYLALNASVLVAVPWQEIAKSPYIAALVVERSWGHGAALVVTLAILVVAFASTYGLLLESSRIPFAAARDGAFLPAFARLHPRGKFPYVSLLAIGILALPATFLPLDQVIAALTAGIVLVQGIGQIVALAVLRARGERSPFRMPLYPLPALIALAGWIFAFASSGFWAIGFGLLTLSAGAIVYFMHARQSATWPFSRALASAAFALGLAALVPQTACAQPATPVPFRAAALANEKGYPALFVEGKPAFVWASAFFYERLPRAQWRPALERLRALGVNTIDLYLIWNWHETADGAFDFDGRTNERRDLRTVLALCRELGFRLILRPGPVIRNEWRNAGYPAWLLERPEYGMPQHDILEGRYPATATLQNARSDDAAAQWMANPTHMRYAKRWLERAIAEVAPYADRVIAVALDDDQGAYIDNQTWPAPHFHAYLRALGTIVRDAMRANGRGRGAPTVPLFVNTYEMKVTASSPFWAMGNWYQSDAELIGEHDRTQLEFATGLLQTQPHAPVMISEFQAGWLQSPDDVRPRRADPSNTTLALHTLLSLGAHGVVDFPMQDTLYPAGMEVPFANAFYAWDAALGLDGRGAPRYDPTAAFGQLVRRYGTRLARTHRVADAAIAYMASAFDAGRIGNDDVFEILARTQAAQRFCRAVQFTCDLVDLRFADAATLARYRTILIPMPKFSTARALALVPAVKAALARYDRAGGTLVAYPVRSGVAGLRREIVFRRDITAQRGADAKAADDPLAPPVATRDEREAAQTLLRRAHARRAVEGVPNGTLLAAASGDLFLDVVNYTLSPQNVFHATVADGRGGRRTLAPFVVQPRDAVLLAVNDRPAITAAAPLERPTPRAALDPAALVPVRDDAPLLTDAFKDVPQNQALAYVADVYHDGARSVVLDNGRVRAVIAADAGARAFVLEDRATGRNCFTSVGALRDDVLVQPPLSTTDRIAKYTHGFPAGLFNRSYAVTLDAQRPQQAVAATFVYEAPDVLPAGARFERRVSLGAKATALEVETKVSFSGDPAAAAAQRAVSITSLAVGSGPASDAKSLVLLPQAQPFARRTSAALAAQGGFGFYDPTSGTLATIVWPANDVEAARVDEKDASVVTFFTLAAGGTRRSSYACERVASRDEAQAVLARRWSDAQGR